MILLVYYNIMNDCLSKYYPPLVSGLEFISIVEAKHYMQRNITLVYQLLNIIERGIT